MAADSKKQHVTFLTEEEIKAVANLCRVAMKLGEDIPYVTELKINGGRSGFNKLVAKVKELGNDADGK